MQGDLDRSMEVGMHGHLSKPILMEALMKALQNAYRIKKE